MMKKIHCIVLLFLGSIIFCFGQEETNFPQYKNQISTNLLLPFAGSFDLTYERTIANKWAVGLSGAIYGDDFGDFDTESSGYYDRTTNFEIMPFVRFYLNSTKTNGHFFEVFGSISQVEQTGGYVRNVNDQGYGVYVIGSENYIVGGLGTGYGYRFLFMKNRLVVEGQLGIRTNFSTNFFFLNVALVRTGIKIGYRF
ncbi:DUF3575 domain-containing protein [Zobellia nedashkovskayae]|uniref:DUF3575 domain-containing protein n=1 Tax=Zobellia nedashkovskayae TaxID=2779510 RepID=UPI00188A854E|nr:DUF3575 domain-containing protein [Zobellia nedashkovskayae]